MGLPWYDLASLLFDPYMDIPYELIDRGFNYYVDNSAVDPGNSGLFYEQAHQRMIKAIGTYLYLSFEKKHLSYFTQLKHGWSVQKYAGWDFLSIIRSGKLLCGHNNAELLIDPRFGKA